MATSGSGQKDSLFDPRVVFRFYSHSKDIYPGKGSGESIPNELLGEFAQLSKFKDWRKKLSNFWICELRIDGLKWASVEHFYHANKYKNNCPHFYRKFSLSYVSSGDEPQWIMNLPENMSTDPAVAKALGGKTGKYKKVAYRPTNLKLDDGFFENGHSEKVMKAGQVAKYEQNPELADLLKATKYAKLEHFVRGQPPLVFLDTMKIRSSLLNERCE